MESWRSSAITWYSRNSICVMDLPVLPLLWTIPFCTGMDSPACGRVDVGTGQTTGRTDDGDWCYSPVRRVQTLVMMMMILVMMTMMPMMMIDVYCRHQDIAWFAGRHVALRLLHRIQWHHFHTIQPQPNFTRKYPCTFTFTVAFVSRLLY